MERRNFEYIMREFGNWRELQALGYDSRVIEQMKDREQEAKLPTNYLINRNSSSGNDVKKDL